ncbi:MAG: putative N(5)-glutamine methyltransferase PrmC [Rhodospirillales bacterium]|nr:putative N(5)-glutamine methyltransferase PrmC [Rhodospirillales bacterium]
METEALVRLLDRVRAQGYEFEPPTPATHARLLARFGDAPGESLRDLLGWSRSVRRDAIAGDVLDALEAASLLQPSGDGTVRSALRVATLGGQAYLHSAFPTEEADAVFFGPDTYRFARAARQCFATRRFARALDLGCGSGAGGLCIAASCSELVLSDINRRALDLAAANALHQASDVLLVESDLFDAIDGAFDLILANPPYIADPGHRTYRDGGGAVGTDLALRIAEESLQRLAPGGVLFLYTGAPIVGGLDALSRAVEQMARAAGCSLTRDEIDPDVFGEELDGAAYARAGVERIAAVALICTRTTA